MTEWLETELGLIILIIWRFFGANEFWFEGWWRRRCSAEEKIQVFCFKRKLHYTYFLDRIDTTKQSTNENCVFQRHVSYSILKSALQPHNLLLKKGRHLYKSKHKLCLHLHIRSMLILEMLLVFEIVKSMFHIESKRMQFTTKRS